MELGDLLEMISGEGKFQFIGKGLTSYPSMDENQQKIHSMCLELESRGLIYRHNESDVWVIWMPVTFKHLWELRQGAKA